MTLYVTARLFKMEPGAATLVSCPCLSLTLMLYNVCIGLVDCFLKEDSFVSNPLCMLWGD